MKFTLHLFLFLLFGSFVLIPLALLGQKSVPLHSNMHITHSVTIKKGTYHLDGADSLSQGAIIIEGNNITVDFNGAVISGNRNEENPDRFKGTCIIIKSGRNITLKNLTVKGYKVGLMARGINGLHINNADFSYNFRQHLNSNRQREDLADWQSYHHNEGDEWLRFGAGIYLRDCDSMDIHNTTVTNGQCGLMMTNCNGGLIYNNNFSFNSGLGIGMYRSSGNRIMYNKVDWNVRGFSFGVYYRGQDSAGILVFENSSNNVFAYNSVTHSGDGLFLWAGQSTMDTGEGGCNDNLIYGNDFSYAPTNAVEITFSRNKVINNKMHDCWHGIWAGFSYNTIIANNDFADNLSAIAIEHGNNNIIAQNQFNGDKVGLELWSSPNRPKDNGFLKQRDTRSMSYTIANNSFNGLRNVISINNTAHVLFTNNKVTESSFQQKFDSTVKDIVIEKTGDGVALVNDSSFYPVLAGIPNGQNAMIPAGKPKGKKYIMMTPWGPYNFDYPMLWLTKADSGRLYFDIIGKPGKWKIKHIKGVTQPSAASGFIPGELSFVKDTSAMKDIDIELEYKGESIVSPFGKLYPAGKAYLFHYREFNPSYNWKMKWFVIDSTHDPVKNENYYNSLQQSMPVKTTEGHDLSSVFEKGFGKNIPTEKIFTESTTEINVPAGLYRLGISASEMVKVFIDGKLVINSWDPTKIIYDADYHNDAFISLNGKHSIRVVQAQYGGYGMLFFSLQPVEKK